MTVINQPLSAAKTQLAADQVEVPSVNDQALVAIAIELRQLNATIEKEVRERNRRRVPRNLLLTQQFTAPPETLSWVDQLKKAVGR